jgi:type II secretory pathway component PulM
MALQADVQYVNYPVDGTAARKVERNTQRIDPVPVYTRRRTERKVIAVDPVALCGILMSAFMIIAMVVGLVQYGQSLRQARQMNAYVQQLHQENLQLQRQYEEGYDLDEVMDIALEAGMVPAEDLDRVFITMQAPQEEDTQMSFWDTVTTFLTGIFA